ncbi:hypothetical protein BUALT_Bualt02G0084100 [Buddleja alternifolia]|uniref:Uncharacterized protein n=1 Tax=Buddleja alternifolia TaxID=168488 RepID=A0AAV6Y956_9LAMI|nr:hypothetical protein BUALT_Bualt02G0084100 [Buddleja alternifolia]
MIGKDGNGVSNCYTYYERLFFSGRVGVFDSVHLMWKGTKVEYRNGLRLVQLIALSSNNLGNPGICGWQIMRSSPRDETHQNPKYTTRNNDDEINNSDDDKFITQEFYIVVGLGFTIAFWGLLGTTLFNQSSRHP